MAIALQTAKLGKLVTFKTGKLDSNAAVLNGDYPFFTCSQETLRTNTFSFDTECVLLAGNNANGIFPLKYFKGKFDAYQRTYVVRPRDTDVLTTKFLYYALRPKLSEFRSISTGAATKFLTLTILNDTEIQLPPLPTQQRIAGILSAYDELIENSQRRIKILESMARALYREWFVHFRFPGHESVPRIPSPLGEIPQGWEVKNLGDLCTLVKDAYRDAQHSELPLLDLARMPSRTLAPQETGQPSELTTSRIVFQPGDTLFGAIRCYLHKVVVMHYPGVTNTSVLVLRPKKAHFRSLLAVVASDAETIRWAETQSTGTKMPVINWGVFQNMPTPIPTQSLAQEYERLAGPILDEIGTLATQIQNLRRTRDLLLPRLLSGQINVEAISS
jgi:type I restriction enzyme S subunit